MTEYFFNVWFLVYLVGVFLVGLPMAGKSIQLWSRPTSEDHGLWWWVLFPGVVHDGGRYRGTYSQKYTEAGGWLIGPLAYCKENGDLPHSLIPLYTLITMIFWPLRLVWTMYFLVSIGVLRSVKLSVLFLVRPFIN